MMGPSMSDTGEVAEKFVLSSVAWLAVGSLLAAYFMIAYPLGVEAPLRFVHAHIMTLGFVAMMIFGVAYRMLPLPPLLATGGLYSIDLARYHLWLANGALAGMVLVGIGMMLTKSVVLDYLLTVFGLLQVGAMFLFAYNIYKTLGLRDSDLPFGGGPGGGGPGPGGPGPGGPGGPR